VAGQALNFAYLTPLTSQKYQKPPKLHLQRPTLTPTKSENRNNLAGQALNYLLNSNLTQIKTANAAFAASVPQIWNIQALSHLINHLQPMEIIQPANAVNCSVYYVGMFKCLNRCKIQVYVIRPWKRLTKAQDF
jgi:hypothetical protein